MKTSRRAAGVMAPAGLDASTRDARSPGLDPVRAVAIGWVTIYHAMTFGLVPDAARWTAYSLYLTQKIAFHHVVDGTIPPFGATGYAKLFVALLSATASAAVLYWLVERPFLRLRDRLDRPRRVLAGVAS